MAKFTQNQPTQPNQQKQQQGAQSNVSKGQKPQQQGSFNTSSTTKPQYSNVPTNKQVPTKSTSQNDSSVARTAAAVQGKTKPSNRKG